MLPAVLLHKLAKFYETFSFIEGRSDIDQNGDVQTKWMNKMEQMLQMEQCYKA